MKPGIIAWLVMGSVVSLLLGCVSRGSHQETVQELDAASDRIKVLERKVEDLQHALDTLNRTREGAEAVRGGLEDQIQTLQDELARTKRARQTAESAILELEIRLRTLQQQLQVAERERDQSKAALAGRQRAGAGKSAAPKKSPPVPQPGKDKKSE